MEDRLVSRWEKWAQQDKWEPGEGGGPSPFVQEWPIVENFEPDTIGDTAAELTAKITHSEIYTANATCQAIDYGTMSAIRDNRFANCITAPGNQAVGSTIITEVGEGWVPADDGVIVCEGIFYVSGSGAQPEFYARSIDDQEGFHAYQAGVNANCYLRTAHLGVYTNKLGPLALNVSTQNIWLYFAAQYNFLNNQVFFRMIQLSTNPAFQNDSGWVGGTVSGPTFDQNVEIRKSQPIARSNTTADCGLAQGIILRDNNYSLGAARTANYQDPS